MELRETLQYASGPGANVAIGAVISFLANWIPGFGRLGRKAKRIFIFLVCIAVPLGATYFLWRIDPEMKPTDLYDQANALWHALVAGATAFSSSQMVHLRQV